ncbi:MAG TPA: hypothetical protein VI455_16760 [Terriglobia bacterium]
MSIGGIDSGPSAELSSSNQQGLSANQIAALLDSNQTQTAAALQLIQSVGQAPETQVGQEPLAQRDPQAAQQGGQLDVHA